MNDSAPKAWHHVHSAEVLRLLEVEVGNGLTSEEIKRRQAKFGPNVVRPGEARRRG